MQHTNKTILISGGTSGVGKAIARSFAQKGYNVTIIGRNVAKAQNAVQELQRSSGNSEISYLIGDLADQTQNNAIAELYRSNHSTLDILVNSAGSMPESAEENINTNLRSHYWLTKNLAPALAATDHAHVFIMTGFPQAIKFGPISEAQRTKVDRGLWLLTHKTLLVSLLADELSHDGINVNALFPGEVKSNLMKWTQNVQNESVPAVERVIESPELSAVTGGFFDDRGAIVKLSSRKYNSTKAKKILSCYL